MTNVMVVGGGPAGLRAAESLARFGLEVTLVEQESYLGGAVARHRYQVLMPHFDSGPAVLDRMVSAVAENPRIHIRTGSRIGQVEETDDGFQVEILGRETGVESVRAVVLATGFTHFDPRRDTKYGYGLFPDVITGAELEEMMASGPVTRPSTGEVPKSVAFIYCVGSRDRQVGNTYCSRVCCAVSAKQGIEVREQLPGARLVMFYMDVRTYGLWEDELYWRAQEDAGVVYVKGRVAEITQRDGRPVLKGEDTLVRGPFEWEFDLVVLAAGMEPGEATAELAAQFGIEREPHGFFQQTRPMENASVTSHPGVFVAGAASGPKTIEDSVMEGEVAAMAVLRYLDSKVTV
ncbi:MAG: FAD-dependent oxidoreductase [Thermaerobacter sp.]|nr:FAD-dependent oxidoreductase [Thermaerobacter sp.]